MLLVVELVYPKLGRDRHPGQYVLPGVPVMHNRAVLVLSPTTIVGKVSANGRRYCIRISIPA